MVSAEDLFQRVCHVDPNIREPNLSVKFNDNKRRRVTLKRSAPEELEGPSKRTRSASKVLRLEGPQASPPSNAPVPADPIPTSELPFYVSSDEEEIEPLRRKKKRLGGLGRSSMVVSSEEDSPTAGDSEEDFELPDFEPSFTGPPSLQKDKGKAVDQRYHPSWK